MTNANWPKTYEEFLEQRETAIRSEKWTDRVLIAGYWYEQNKALTDEVLATREYIRRRDAGELTTEQIKLVKRQ